MGDDWGCPRRRGQEAVHRRTKVGHDSHAVNAMPSCPGLVLCGGLWFSVPTLMIPTTSQVLLSGG